MERVVDLWYTIGSGAWSLDKAASVFFWGSFVAFGASLLVAVSYYPNLVLSIIVVTAGFVAWLAMLQYSTDLLARTYKLRDDELLRR